ncbi:unnamed protein product, partial [Polarella glacialis]
MCSLQSAAIMAGPGYQNYSQQAVAKGHSVASLTDLGNRQKASGDLQGAAGSFYEVLSFDHNSVTAHLGLGAICLASGDLARALEHTEKAYSLQPTSAEAMSTIGTICRTQGSLEAASQWYKAALQVNPHCESTVVSLAVTLVSQGLQLKASDPKGAIACYNEALVHCPTNANAYYNL